MKYFYFGYVAIILTILVWGMWPPRRPRRDNKPALEPHMTGIPVQDTIPGQMYERMIFECPKCHRDPLWLKGPEGGISINVMCGHCHAQFNVTPFIGIAEEIT